MPQRGDAIKKGIQPGTRPHLLPLDASSSPLQTPIRKFQIPVSKVGNGKGLCFISFLFFSAQNQGDGAPALLGHGCSHQPQTGRKSSRALGKLQGCGLGCLAEAEHSLSATGPQQREQRKYQQNPKNATKKPARNRRAGGDTSHQAQGEERLSLREFHGWIQQDSTCSSTSPHCHKHSEELGRVGGPEPPDLGPGGSEGVG